MLCCVTMGTQLPRKKRHSPTQSLAHVYSGQTAGWMKMSLGVEVNLGPSDVVLDEVAAPPLLKGAEPPVLGSCLLWPNSWMNEDATWYGSRPRPRPHCVRRRPSCPCKRGTTVFRPMSIVATVAHLSYCWALVIHEPSCCYWWWWLRLNFHG